MCLVQLQGSGKQFESLSQSTSFFQNCLQSVHLRQGRTVHGTNTHREGPGRLPSHVMPYHFDASAYCFKALLPQVNPHSSSSLRGNRKKLPSFHHVLLHPSGYNGSYIRLGCDSVQFSRSVVSNSLQPHESQHAGPLCPSPTPGVHSDSCPLSR